MSPLEVEPVYDDPTLAYDDPAPVALRALGVMPRIVVEEVPQASPTAQADTAIAALVRAHGLATVGDLMAVLGIESMPHLLAMLGFSGDLPESALLGQDIDDIPGEMSR